VCGICSTDLVAQDVRLERDLSADAGFVSADKVRLQQAIWNILRNALKFTPTKGTIRVTTARLAANRCEVRVCDSGIGIPPENLLQIFQAFEQGGAGVTRQFGGLGLGLAISKAVVELHGGSIRAESKGRDQGATFVIELAAQTTPLPDFVAAAAPAVDGVAKSLRVLLVEDHADTARALTRLLRKAGLSVILASDAAAARDAAERETFDILVSDLGLPDGNGYEIMSFVRTVRGVPGIVMSGYGTEADRRRTREAGFSEHLVKPIDIEQLVTAIHRVTSDRN
jgi:two-component system CheB/CheR fusion protein